MAAYYNSHPLPAPPGEGQEPSNYYSGNNNYSSPQSQQFAVAQSPQAQAQTQEQYDRQYQTPRYGQQQYQQPPQLSHQHSQQQVAYGRSQQHQEVPPQQPVHQRQHQQSSGPPPTRPAHQTRKSRGFSFRSDRSGDLVETHDEKEAKRLHSKADPTLAINEMEPAAVAAEVRSSLASVREIQHRDMTGQLITEPDRSNPTRWRFERPLATINSFQDAIDSGYARESAMSRRHSTAPGTIPEHLILKSMQAHAHTALGSMERFNPRTSMMASREYSRNSYYGNRPQSFVNGGENEQSDEYLGPRSHALGYPSVNQNSWNGMPRRGPGGRMSSEPQMRGPRYQGPNVYPDSGHQQSRETVASGSGSGSGMSGEQAGYQTDPTSDNSSIERRQSPPHPVNDYGIGFGGNSGQPAAFTVGIKGPAVPGQSYGNYPGAHPSGPPVPHKEMHGKSAILRKPTAPSAAPPPQRPAAAEKRKSWFGRRFSKNN